MVKYYKQEMPDIKGTGEKKCYYRMKSRGNISADELVERMAHPGSGLSKGAVLHVFHSLAEEIARAIASGYSVTLPDIGIFSGAIALRKDITMETLNTDEVQRNSLSLEINNIHYRANKSLISAANSNCSLERGKINMLHRSPFTKEQRLKMAIDFISEKGFIRVNDYKNITLLSKSSAALELVEFVNDINNPITSYGRGCSKIYTLNS